MKSLTAQSAVYYSMHNPRELGGAVTLEFDNKSERFKFEVKFTNDDNVIFFLYRNDGDLFFRGSFPDQLITPPPMTEGEIWLAAMMQLLVYQSVIDFEKNGIAVTPEIDVLPLDSETLSLISAVLESGEHDKKTEN